MESQLKLIRFDYNETATLGKLYYPDGRSWFLYTMEPPWVGNEPFESCIPEGLYRITRDDFKGEYENFRLHGVHGRTDIELHAGDVVGHTQGCPLIGERLEGALAAGWKFTGLSRRALDTLMKGCPFDEGTILVTSSTGRPW